MRAPAYLMADPCSRRCFFSSQYVGEDLIEGIVHAFFFFLAFSSNAVPFSFFSSYLSDERIWIPTRNERSFFFFLCVCVGTSSLCTRCIIDEMNELEDSNSKQ